MLSNSIDTFELERRFSRMVIQFTKKEQAALLKYLTSMDDRFVKLFNHLIFEMDRDDIEISREPELRMRHQSGYFRVKVADILFAEITSDKRLALITKTGIISLSGVTLNSLLDEINDGCIIRSSKSSAVNVNNISRIMQITCKTWDTQFDFLQDRVCRLSYHYYASVVAAFMRAAPEKQSEFVK